MEPEKLFTVLDFLGREAGDPVGSTRHLAHFFTACFPLLLRNALLSTYYGYLLASSIFMRCT